MSAPPDPLRASYDAVAAAYVEHIYTELAQKPLDRHLLNRFAEEVRERGTVGDLGCGPGHVARYLHDQGVRMLGVDIPETQHAGRETGEAEPKPGERAERGAVPRPRK